MQMDLFDDEFKDPRLWEDIDPDRKYTTKEVAEILRCSRSTVYNYIYTQRLKQVWFGGYRIPGWSIIEYIRSNSTED